MEVIRVLRYHGPEAWVQNTLNRSLKGGMQLNLRDGVAGIQEFRIPHWLSKILSWYASHQPHAIVHPGLGGYHEIDERGKSL